MRADSASSPASPELSPPALEKLIARMKAVPLSKKLDFRLVSAGVGRCTARVPYNPEYDGVFECFHGGILMTIADSVACFAILTQTGPDQALATTDMNIRFLAPCLSEVRAEARVIKLGRSMCPVAIDLFDAEDRQVAVAQVNYILLPKEAAGREAR